MSERSNLLLSQLLLQPVLPLQGLHHDRLPPPLQVDWQQLQGLPVLLRLWAHLCRGARLSQKKVGCVQKQSWQDCYDTAVMLVLVWRKNSASSGAALIPPPSQTARAWNSPGFVAEVSGRASALRRLLDDELAPLNTETKRTEKNREDEIDENDSFFFFLHLKTISESIRSNMIFNRCSASPLQYSTVEVCSSQYFFCSRKLFCISDMLEISKRTLEKGIYWNTKMIFSLFCLNFSKCIDT